MSWRGSGPGTGCGCPRACTSSCRRRDPVRYRDDPADQKSVLFIIPWGARWIVGTTDTDWSGDRDEPA